jgi:hypothetical protein
MKLIPKHSNQMGTFPLKSINVVDFIFIVFSNAGATNLPVMGVWLTEEGESPCRPDQEKCIFQPQVSIASFCRGGRAH